MTGDYCLRTFVHEFKKLWIDAVLLCEFPAGALVMPVSTRSRTRNEDRL